jgi:hypothetical protein
MEEIDELERRACVLVPLLPGDFNRMAALPYGCTISHIFAAMSDFLSFLGIVNSALNTQGLARLESLLMPANFSSVVSEFMAEALPKRCAPLVRNTYHNGHPDLLPAGQFPGNAVQHASEGVEIKASRYGKAWQGHNAEDTWLMVFVFDSNRPADSRAGVGPRPFRFVKVVGARLTRADWTFSGRSGQSRRTITASVTEVGAARMNANWIYRAPGEV